MAVFGFSVTNGIFFSPPRCYNGTKEVIAMMELEDSRQQLKFISEDLRAIRAVALLADEEPEWDTEGDIVRLIALATEPVMQKVEEVISSLDAVIGEGKGDTDVATG